jgi:hypothetical protein
MSEAPTPILDLDEYVPYWMASISRVLQAAEHQLLRRQPEDELRAATAGASRERRR